MTEKAHEAMIKDLRSYAHDNESLFPLIYLLEDTEKRLSDIEMKLGWLIRQQKAPSKSVDEVRKREC